MLQNCLCISDDNLIQLNHGHVCIWKDCQSHSIDFLYILSTFSIYNPVEQGLKDNYCSYNCTAALEATLLGKEEKIKERKVLMLGTKPEFLWGSRKKKLVLIYNTDEPTSWFCHLSQICEIFFWHSLAQHWQGCSCISAISVIICHGIVMFGMNQPILHAVK